MSVFQKAHVLGALIAVSMIGEDAESLRIKRMQPTVTVNKVSGLGIGARRQVQIENQKAEMPDVDDPYQVRLAGANILEMAKSIEAANGGNKSKIAQTRIKPLSTIQLELKPAPYSNAYRNSAKKDAAGNRMHRRSYTALSAVPNHQTQSTGNLSLPLVHGKGTKKNLVGTSSSSLSLATNRLQQTSEYGLPQIQGKSTQKAKISNGASSQGHRSAKSLKAQMYDLDGSLRPSLVRKAREDAATNGRERPREIANQRKRKQLADAQKLQNRYRGLQMQLEMGLEGRQSIKLKEIDEQENPRKSRNMTFDNVSVSTQFS